MSLPEPTRNAVTEPYWSALEHGRLGYQHCPSCGNDWLPARENCPNCLTPEPEWKSASGQGTLVSWIVYHKAYAPHLEHRLPYNVAIVELAEGPRIVTNIVDRPDGSGLREGDAVELSIEEDFGLHLPRFRLRDA
jgi:uncharacterized OB-fold protein